MNIRWFQRGMVSLIMIASLFASVQNLISTKELGSVRDDPVADWEKRFAPIKEQLPFQRGVVGYISDSSVAGAAYDAANDEGEYVLTQYVLAPIIIVQLQETIRQLRQTQNELKARMDAQQAAEQRLLQAAKLAAVGEMASGMAAQV